MDTIAAIATPMGEGAIGIIRISGKEAFAVANRVFSGNVPSYASHTAHFGKILSASGEVIDEGLLLCMHEGRSYTGEASVEIMCHGGVFVTQAVLARVLEAGARAAGPGEFSLRAFRNGRIDLAQAEAVQALIAAKNADALRAAKDQLQGRLSVLVKDLQARLTDITAILEAWVDYPEEGLEFATDEEILSMLQESLDRLQALSDSFHDGARLQGGATLCLLGAPNVGKSSLMNALLDQDRAIVTEVAGTTRDLLCEEVRIGGVAFRLIDTAGIRETTEIVEQEGIRRSKKAAEEADLVLYVQDVTQPTPCPKEAFVIWNKCDLPHTPPPFGIAVSAKTGEGISALKEAIVAAVRMPDKGSLLLTKERHFSLVNEAIHHVTTVINGFHTVSPEFLVFDLRAALKALAGIIGTNVTEDILGAIFANFCVGK